MVPKERTNDLRFIRLEPPLHFAPQRPARKRPRRQRRKGQYGRALHFTGQQEPTGCAIGIPRRPRSRQIACKGLGQGFGGNFVQGGLGIRRRQLRKKGRSLGPFFDPGERLLRPCLKVQRQKPKVHQPFAGVIHNIQMHCPRPLKPGQKARGPHAQRQAQFTDRACAIRPGRRPASDGRKMGLIIKSRDRVIGLRLQKRGLDPPFGLRQQMRHTSAIQQIGDQRCDEHCLARPRQPGHAQAQRWLAEKVLARGIEPVDNVPRAVRKCRKYHRAYVPSSSYER